jgi:hypothetical protein
MYSWWRLRHLTKDRPVLLSERTLRDCCDCNGRTLSFLCAAPRWNYWQLWSDFGADVDTLIGHKWVPCLGFCTESDEPSCSITVNSFISYMQLGIVYNAHMPELRVVKVYSWRGGKIPRTVDPCTRWWYVVSFTIRQDSFQRNGQGCHYIQLQMSPKAVKKKNPKTIGFCPYNYENIPGNRIRRNENVGLSYDSGLCFENLQ